MREGVCERKRETCARNRNPASYGRLNVTNDSLRGRKSPTGHVTAGIIPTLFHPIEIDYQDVQDRSVIGFIFVYSVLSSIEKYR